MKDTLPGLSKKTNRSYKRTTERSFVDIIVELTFIGTYTCF